MWFNRFFMLLVCAWAHVMRSDATQSDAINWEDSKFINLLSNVLSTDPSNPCAKDMLLNIIDSLTNGTGALRIPLSVMVPVPLVGDLNITEVVIGGLNTLNAATILQPQDEYYLFNHLALTDATVDIKGRAVSNPLIGQPVHETFVITVSALTLFFFFSCARCTHTHDLACPLSLETAGHRRRRAGLAAVPGGFVDQAGQPLPGPGSQHGLPRAGNLRLERVGRGLERGQPLLRLHREGGQRRQGLPLLLNHRQAAVQARGGPPKPCLAGRGGRRGIGPRFGPRFGPRRRSGSSLDRPGHGCPWPRTRGCGRLGGLPATRRARARVPAGVVHGLHGARQLLRKARRGAREHRRGRGQRRHRVQNRAAV